MALALDVDPWVGADRPTGGAATDADPPGLARGRRWVRGTGSTTVWQELGRSTAHVCRSGRVSAGDPRSPRPGR